MGVDNLWQLLDAAGTKVTLDSLATRKLAVDASLWLVQFIKAMRDPNGEMVENCHLLGLFRRICKLLFYDIKPVFVFDGPAPKLKRKTLKQRKIRRERSENDIKKLAERYFLNRCQMAAISVSKKQLKEIQRQKELQSITEDEEDTKEEANSDAVDVEEEDNHNRNRNHNKKKSRRRRKSSIKKKTKKKAKDKSDEMMEDESIDRIGLDQMEGGFFFAERVVVGNDQNEGSERKENGKEERSDSEEELASRPLVPLQDEDKENDDASMDDSDSMLQTSNEFHKLPTNIANMTAEDIAQLPASMQYEIMQKRRELLRHKTRPEFFKASESPTKYAAVQLKSFLKTSSLNQRIEALRKQTADEFNQQLAAEQMGENDVGTIGRIASDGSKFFSIKQTADSNKAKNKRFRFEWMDQQTKDKRREYMNKQRRKKRRKSKWAVHTDYVARTLQIDMDNVRVGNAAAKCLIFEHWSCPQCKYLNLKQRKQCDVCGMVKGEALKQWVCDECTHQNEGKEKVCALCDTPNPLLLADHLKPLRLPSREPMLVVSDSEPDTTITTRNNDTNSWMCPSCNWKNGNLHSNCVGCQAIRPSSIDYSAPEISLCDKEEADMLDIEPLALLLEGSQEEQSSKVQREKGIESVLCSPPKVRVVRSSDDEDVALEAPPLTLLLEDDINEVIHEESGHVSPSKEQQSPSKSSSLSQMASANVQKLVSIRDSLQNFYNLSGMTQQPAVLEELRAMEVEDEPLMLHDNDKQMEFEHPTGFRRESNGDDATKMNEEMENVHQDFNEIQVQLSRKDDVTMQEEPEQNNMFSDHDSDDAIMEDMDCVPTPGGIQTMKKMVNNQIGTAIALDRKSVDHVDEEEEEEVSPHKPLRRSRRLCKKRTLSETGFDDVSGNGKGGINKKRRVMQKMKSPQVQVLRVNVKESAAISCDTPSLQIDAEISGIKSSRNASNEDSLGEKMKLNESSSAMMEYNHLSQKENADPPIDISTPPPVKEGRSSNEDTVPDSFLFDIPSMDDVMDQANQEALRFEQQMQKTPSKTPEDNTRRREDNEDEEKAVIEMINNEGNIKNSSVDRGLSLNEGQIENSLHRLNAMEDSIMEDNILLQADQATAMRNSEHVTPEMVAECRAMLDLFGIPYITSPSEAEAQCGMLEILGLVDGVITDDADVLLFGGETIFKHMFHMNRHVEKYTASLLESKLGLTRHKLIALALLLGSDYTDGIKGLWSDRMQRVLEYMDTLRMELILKLKQGIGPVNGIEILQTFCLESDSITEGLTAFKQWMYSTDVETKPKKKANMETMQYQQYVENKKAWFKYQNFQQKMLSPLSEFIPVCLRKIHRVMIQEMLYQTYLNPEVDSSEVPFEWGTPDVETLRKLCQDKFGWDQLTISRTLDPIASVVEKGRGAVQSSILSFADWVQPNKEVKSQRVKNAVKALIAETEWKKRIQEQSR